MSLPISEEAIKIIIHIINEFKPYAILIMCLLLIACLILLIDNRRKINANIKGKSSTLMKTKHSDTNHGERIVSEEINGLSKDIILIDNIKFRIPGNHYNTQIDHVLISPDGIFAIETKYWKGDTNIISIGDCVSNEADVYNLKDYIYNDSFILNISREKGINLYTADGEKNPMLQAVSHASDLQKLISNAGVDFVRGILVFVDNDKCKPHVRSTRIGEICIMSLTSFKACVEYGYLKGIYDRENYKIDVEKVAEILNQYKL